MRQFFLMLSFFSETVHSLMNSFSSSFYLLLRPRIIAEDDIDVLCELLSVMQSDIIEEQVGLRVRACVFYFLPWTIAHFIHRNRQITATVCHALLIR
jgi:hypothetical protein